MYPTMCRTDSYRGAASEDRAATFTLPDGSLLLVAADGVGGQAGGGEAADLAVRRVLEEAPGLRTNGPRAWRSLLMALDSEISDANEAGQTTLAVVCITPKRRVVGASVGDTEAWLVTPGGHFKLTGGQRRKPYLGSGMTTPIAFAMSAPREGGTIVLATDGLFRYAPHEALEEAALLPDLEEAATLLVNLARLPTGALPDDIAVLLCRLPATGKASSFNARLFTLFRRG